jgi:ABC-type transport system involved in multi-copper enzyme maturation permease subunit
MIALLASELRRFRSRRLAKAFVLLELLSIVVAGVIVYVTQEYDLASFPNVLQGSSLVLLSVAWILGASSIGAEWHAGFMTTLLTWESRRGRVMVAKIVACLVSVFILSLALQAVLGIVLAIDAAGRGSTAGVDASWLADSAGVGFRVALLSTVFAGFGFALAAAGRNTTVALGVAFGYLVIVENLVRGLRPQWMPWSLSENAALVVTNDPHLSLPLQGRTTLEAGLYLALVGLALLLGAAGLFRARDVT